MENIKPPVMFWWTINESKYIKLLRIGLNLIFFFLPLLIEILFSIFFKSYSIKKDSEYFIRITGDSIHQGLLKNGENKGYLRPASSKNRLGYDFSDFEIAVIKFEDIEEIVISPSNDRIIIRMREGKRAFINFDSKNLKYLEKVYAVLNERISDYIKYKSMP